MINCALNFFLFLLAKKKFCYFSILNILMITIKTRASVKIWRNLLGNLACENSLTDHVKNGINNVDVERVRIRFVRFTEWRRQHFLTFRRRFRFFWWSSILVGLFWTVFGLFGGRTISACFWDVAFGGLGVVLTRNRKKVKFVVEIGTCATLTGTFNLWNERKK